ncbi:alpha/beta fold hydrolase [Streptomyces sp. E1N211]|uniref:alpha/beta fold hydrolase n=1 Tax=Streptomyces sp. E1N211 TaxID=1851876 RepID=UPI001F4DEA79|nr:alpha/beta fold hydrolase [Streptomyces sp. E1N211]
MLGELSERLRGGHHANALPPSFRRGAAAGAVGLVLLATGLTATARDEPDLGRFYDQKIEWAACEGTELPKDLQCGTLTVPLDYADPGDGTLELALARYRASSDDPRGSVVLNFGGPGGSGVQGLAYGRKDFLGLTDDYDVVSFDPRGVGRSSPVSCGADATSRALEATDGEEMGDPRDALRQLREVAAECEKHSGPVLAHMGTVDVARDLDVMRDTLAEPLAEQGLASARGQQTALENFLTWCTEELACPFGQDARAAREAVVDLVRSLDDTPVPTDFGYEFTGQDLAGAIAQGLYTKEMWPVLQRVLAQLMEDGDTSGVEALASGGMAPAPPPDARPRASPRWASPRPCCTPTTSRRACPWTGCRPPGRAQPCSTGSSPPLLPGIRPGCSCGAPAAGTSTAFRAGPPGCGRRRYRTERGSRTERDDRRPGVRSRAGVGSRAASVRSQAGRTVAAPGPARSTGRDARAKPRASRTRPALRWAPWSASPPFARVTEGPAHRRRFTAGSGPTDAPFPPGRPALSPKGTLPCASARSPHGTSRP